MEIVRQKTAEAHWIDESGEKVQFKRISKLEKKRETEAYKIAKEAMSVNQALIDLKERVSSKCDEIFSAVMKENNVDLSKHKGNFIWYNFDQSIKVSAKTSEPIKFDDGAITAAKAHFDKFFENAVQSDVDYVKEMIISAFESRNGQLDTKEVLKLLKWETKIKNEDYQNGCAAIKNAIRRPKSKTYYTIALKNEQGEFENVELNLARV